MLSGEITNDNFNNFEIIKEIQSNLKLFNHPTRHSYWNGVPTFNQHRMNLGINCLKRLLVYNDSGLLNHVVQPIHAENDFMSINLFASTTSCRSGDIGNLEELIKRLNELNNITNIMNEIRIDIDMSSFDQQIGLCGWILVPQGLKKWLHHFVLHELGEVHLIELIRLRDLTNINTLVFYIFSFISQLKEGPFRLLFKSVKNYHYKFIEEGYRTKDMKTSDFRLVPIHKICAEIDISGSVLDEPDLLLKMRSWNNPLHNNKPNYTNWFKSEEEDLVVHQPIKDIRRAFVFEKSNKDQQKLPLDWTDLKPKNEDANVPMIKPKASKLKRKLNMFFRLQRTNKRTLRDIKTILKREVFRNETAKRLYESENSEPPPVLEPTINSKHLTNRLANRILPFDNAWFDEGYDSDSDHLVADRDTSNNVAQLISSVQLKPKPDQTLKGNENFTAQTVLDKCSTQQIIDFNEDCGGDNELGVNDNTLISDEVSVSATLTAKKTEEKEELHNHNEISTTNVEKHRDGVANALTSSAEEEGTPAEGRKIHNWFDLKRYVNGLIKS